MIRINLLKAEQKKRGVSIDLTALKGLKVQYLLKVGSLYYAGAFFWIVVILAVGYYFKLNQDKGELRRKIEELNAEKNKLQAQSRSFLEQKQSLEAEITRLKAQIQDIDKSKDIIVGLKSYYNPFNKSLDLYTISLPKASWINNYRQSLDINTQTVKSELDINTFDYQSISAYGSIVGSRSKKIAISPVERRATPSGFEYYNAKLSVESVIQEGR
ncbi:MAG: hypothetical protein ACK4KZ_02810 [Aquificaceae bacterium]